MNSGAIYGYTDRPRSADASHRARTSVGLLCRMYMGWDKNNAALSDGVEWMAEMGPDLGARVNMYYNYYATQAMKHFGGKRPGMAKCETSSLKNNPPTEMPKGVGGLARLRMLPMLAAGCTSRHSPA